MGWYYDFHIKDDEYNCGNTLSFGRGGDSEYEWRIDTGFSDRTKDGDWEDRFVSVWFTDEQARQLYEWLGQELMKNYRRMEKLATDRLGKE